MDFGEGIAVSLIVDLSDKCPFREKEVKNPSVQKENTGNDDVASAQKNAGSILGANLAAGTHGDPEYLNDDDGCYPAEKIREEDREKRQDSTTGDPVKGKIRVGGEDYHYIVAAHHLIPGNASLKNSDLFNYMRKGKKVKTTRGEKIIKANIGYCVNGAHNGVWLPGNYAFSTGVAKMPTRKRWSKYVKTPAGFDWATMYMVGAVKTAGGQFHDSHTTYNENARDKLDEMAIALAVHPDCCELCAQKRKILPPYRIKQELYDFSGWLKQRLVSPPDAWKDPWMTSDRFKEFITTKRKRFLDAYKRY